MASISCGKLLKLTSIRWLTWMPRYCSIVCDGERGAAEGVRGVDLVGAVAGDVDDRVARDREPRVLAAADAHQQDRVRAAAAGGRAGLLGALGPRVGAEHQDRVGAGQREAGAAEVDLAAEVALLELGADEKEDEREGDPADGGEDEPLDDAADGERPAGRARPAGEREAARAPWRQVAVVAVRPDRVVRGRGGRRDAVVRGARRAGRRSAALRPWVRGAGSRGPIGTSCTRVGGRRGSTSSG